MVIILVAFLGLCFGSLANAVVWRTYKQQRSKKGVRVSPAQAKRYSILTARSMCPHCEHVLGPQDLIPVLSWLILRGKCRYCNASIAVQYPAVELAGVVLAVASYLLWPRPIDTSYEIVVFGLWLVLLPVLLALAVYDIRWRLLPNRLVAATTIGAVAVSLAVTLSSGMWTDLIYALLAGAVFFGFFYVLFQLSSGKWIGGGDVKLAFALGVLAGSPQNVVLVIFFASVLGTLYSVVAALMRRSPLGPKTQLPFGPWLILAAIVVMLAGSDIFSWYGNLLSPL